MSQTKTPTVPELAQKNKIQTKILSADVTTDGVISDLTFNNLKVGKWYEVSGLVYFLVKNGGVDGNVNFEAVHNSSNIYFINFNMSDGGSSSNNASTALSFKFQATATSLTFEASSNTTNTAILGNGTLAETHVQIEERNDIIETTDFT